MDIRVRVRVSPGPPVEASTLPSPSLPSKGTGSKGRGKNRRNTQSNPPVPRDPLLSSTSPGVLSSSGQPDDELEATRCRCSTPGRRHLHLHLHLHRSSRRSHRQTHREAR